MITFHTRVSHAQAFAGAPPRGIQQYLDDFIVDHVNGTQRVADRKAILVGFKDEQKRLVTNARCLTEGVDLPAVDMVVFSNPRKSRIDIVQAVGRAMRRPQGADKALGYVVVPVMLAPHQTADIAAACASTDWEDVIDVLAALREQDTRLDEIIRAQQIAKGRGEVFNPRAFVERVQMLRPHVAFEVLEPQIAAVIVERLGDSWDERYGNSSRSNKSTGTAMCPLIYSDNFSLGCWVNNQRNRIAQDRLSADRVMRLIALGFLWNLNEVEWEAQFQALVGFKEKHGHCNVPSTYLENPPLGRWVIRQRSARVAGKLWLFTERVARLEALEFQWDAYESIWEAQYQELVAFKEKYGHCNVPVLDPNNPRLGKWLHKQRQKRKRGAMSADVAARLDALGVVWDFRDSWGERFEQLVAFKKRYGHCNPSTGDPDSGALGIWLVWQHLRQGERKLIPRQTVASRRRWA